MEALDLLHQAAGGGRVIAGGTDLILQLKRGKHHAELLVDITDIAELKHIHDENDYLRIGAGMTHADVAKTPSIQREAKALAEGCAQMGSTQIQNMATLVGNVVTARSAADGAIPLMALDAELNVASKEGRRWLPIKQVYRGVGTSAVDPRREIVTEVRFRKLGEWSGTGFFRTAMRKTFAFPLLNGAVALLFYPSTQRIKEARIAIGAVAEKPFRSRKAEAILESRETSPEMILEASRAASDEFSPGTSLRGSALYRKEMVRVGLSRTIGRILEEANREL